MITNKKTKRSTNIQDSDDEDFTGNDLITNYSNTNTPSYRILEPFRILGLIVDYNQVVYFKRGTDRFMLASNFNSFLVYNLEKLRLERISPPLPSNISGLAVYKNKILTSTENVIQMWDKIHIMKEYTCEGKVKSILTFDKILMSINSLGDLFIHDIHTTERLKELNLKIEHFIHPLTYLNKILFTKIPEQYELDLNVIKSKIYLYNVNTEKIIFEFDLEINSRITTIEQSPVIDIVGIGFASGDIIVFNLKTLKKLLHFKSSYPVTRMSFSNCSSLNLSLLATSTPIREIHLWDLNKKSLHYTITNTDPASDLIFLMNEPLLIATSGSCNSIRMFKFDENTGVPTILKQRTGHGKNPHRIRFYGDNANNEAHHILSASESEIKNISLLNEHMTKDFSLKNVEKILRNHNSSKILSFDYNEFRERDWANILLCLRQCEFPILLSYENSSAVNKVIERKTKDSYCTSVCISMCGNFGFVGYENGALEKFNMQSGLNRWIVEKAHSSTIIGIKSDGLNSIVVTISLDCKLKFWDIYQSTLLKTIELDGIPTLLELNRDNDLIAIGLLNSEVHVYDKSSFKLVRQFKNGGKIKDLCFSKDGKWLITVSDDKSLKIFDVLSSNLVEWVEFNHMPLSVSISPNGQYIAVSFINMNGVYLYVNRTLFMDFADLEEVKRPVKINHNFLKIRKLKSRKDFSELREEIDQETRDSKSEFDLTCKENDELVTFSSENKLKYKILNNLEQIQERNEPKIKNKDKAKAPFFLFNLDDALGNKNPMVDNQEASEEFLNILKNCSHFKNDKLIKSKVGSDFILKDLLLLYEDKKVKSREITQFLNSLNPYLVDLEIRTLDSLMTGGNNLLEIFLNYINEELESKSNYELIQAYLNRFLKIFTEDSIQDRNLKDKLSIINKKLINSFEELDYLYKNTLCLVTHFGKIQI